MSRAESTPVEVEEGAVAIFVGREVKYKLVDHF
jgi:hypothetical protein